MNVNAGNPLNYLAQKFKYERRTDSNFFFYFTAGL